MNDILRKVRRERLTEERVRSLDAHEIVNEIHFLQDRAEAHEAERDALREALIRASQRLGDLGAHVPDEFSRRRIAEITSDISQALTGLEEA